MRQVRSLVTTVLLAVIAACSSTGSQGAAASQLDDEEQRAAAVITESSIRPHVERLSADAFQGRAPGTAGEDSTIAYIAAQLARMGVRPANADGTFFQRVPLRSLSLTTAEVSIRPGDSPPRNLAFPSQFVVLSTLPLPVVSVERSEVIFGGYGIVAPEHGWNPYRDIDLRGKTVMLLLGHPAPANARDSTRLQDVLTRLQSEGLPLWQHASRTARTRGADAVLFVHEPTRPGSLTTMSYRHFMAVWSCVRRTARRPCPAPSHSCRGRSCRKW